MVGTVSSLRCLMGSGRTGTESVDCAEKEKSIPNTKFDGCNINTQYSTPVYGCMEMKNCNNTETYPDLTKIKCCNSGDNCNDQSLLNSIAPSKTICGALCFTSLLVLFLFQWYSFYCPALLFLLFGSIRPKLSWIGFTGTYSCANFEYR